MSGYWQIGIIPTVRTLHDPKLMSYSDSPRFSLLETWFDSLENMISEEDPADVELEDSLESDSKSGSG